MNLIGLTEIPLFEKISFFPDDFCADSVSDLLYDRQIASTCRTFSMCCPTKQVSARDKFMALLDVWRKKRVIEE